jgi:hypothetical protein
MIKKITLIWLMVSLPMLVYGKLSLSEQNRISQMTASDVLKFGKDPLIIRVDSVLKSVGCNPGRRRIDGKEVIVNKGVDADGAMVTSKIILLHGSYNGDLDAFSYFDPRQGGMGNRASEEPIDYPVLVLEKIAPGKDNGSESPLFSVRASLPLSLVNGGETFRILDTLVSDIERESTLALLDTALKNNDLCCVIAINEMLRRGEFIGPYLGSVLINSKTGEINRIILWLLLRNNRIDVDDWRILFEKMSANARDELLEVIKFLRNNVKGDDAEAQWKYYEMIAKTANEIK